MVIPPPSMPTAAPIRLFPDIETVAVVPRFNCVGDNPCKDGGFAVLIRRTTLLDCVVLPAALTTTTGIAADEVNRTSGTGTASDALLMKFVGKGCPLIF